MMVGATMERGLYQMPGCPRIQVHALQRVRASLAQALLLAALFAAPAWAQAPLDQARQLYNSGQFDEAIELAAKLRGLPATADAAALVIGRARLERFRQSADRADLVAAREALREVRPGELSERDQLEYVIGLGESLYLEESYGAAAELFESVFERSYRAGPVGFNRLFDWWATALDRQAQSGLVEDRDSLYERIRVSGQQALGRDPGSGPAAYWVVVAYRSLGDLVRAWEAAVAGWVRAPLTDDMGAALRADLDRLVLQAIIPERARQMASNDRDRERAAASLRASWETVKREWSPK